MKQFAQSTTLFFPINLMKMGGGGGNLQRGRKRYGEKVKIAPYEQFLLFSQCFQKTCYCRDVKEQGLFRKHSGEREKCSLRAISPFPSVFSKYLLLQRPKKQGLFRKHCGKKEKLLVKSSFSFSRGVFKRLITA